MQFTSKQAYNEGAYIQFTRCKWFILYTSACLRNNKKKFISTVILVLGDPKFTDQFKFGRMENCNKTRDYSATVET